MNRVNTWYFLYQSRLNIYHAAAITTFTTRASAARLFVDTFSVGTKKQMQILIFRVLYEGSSFFGFLCVTSLLADLGGGTWLSLIHI